METRELEGFELRVLSLPYYLASKIEAFRSRARDPRTSHDLEDVVYVLDNRDDVTDQLLSAPDDVMDFLHGEFSAMLEDVTIREAVIANLEYHSQAERFAMIEEKLKGFVDAK